MIKELYNKFLECGGKLTTDSRKIEEGAIYFALSGPRFDGNLFAKDALEAGCRFAVIDNVQYNYNEQCILVENVLETLQQLANYHRHQLKLPVLAITGSNGKTTTKELLSAVLSKKYSVVATKGNLNNHIGVPLTLLSINNSHEFAIIEMGANHVGEIAALCNIAEPDYGMITNIGKAHLEGFGGPAGVIKAKNELYQFINRKHRTLFVNADDKLLMELSIDIDRVTYGKGHADYTAKSFMKDEFAGLGVGEQNVVSHLAGEYNFYNLLSAYSVGLHFGVSKTDALKAIEEYEPDNNRSQLVQHGSNKILMDAYNANPTSMHVALENIVKITAKKKILILGDMLELGEDSKTEHENLLHYIEENGLMHQTLLVGEQFAKVASTKDFRCFMDVEALCSWLKSNKPHDSYILVKGSRGIKLERILEVI